MVGEHMLIAFEGSIDEGVFVIQNAGLDEGGWRLVLNWA